MSRLIKTDFHLHTCYSDNQDRMRPEEYVALARQGGYAAIGFCDHHHNLTQESWRELRAAVESLSAPDLLLNTGYEATFVTGHLCVLDKRDFDGATARQCAQQMWRPDNRRIVAHPDNNSCAWRLPLPVDADGVEIINGGQDLYAHLPTSPCNGLRTYQTYLLLDHPLAALAQSDCHQRAIFGRVWTGMWLADDQETTWAAIYAALAARRTFAAMGDLVLHAWQEEGGGGQPVLRWQVSQGAAVQVYCTDRPVAYLDAEAAQAGVFTPTCNGHYWLLARRGLAWAVSSPLTVTTLPGDSRQGAARRAALLADPLLDRQSAALRFRLDTLLAYEAAWAASAFPVRRYHQWLAALLPEHWGRHEFTDEGAELRRRAQLRLQQAAALAGAVLQDVLRQHYRPQLGEGAGLHAVLAAPAGGGGAVQFEIDAPRAWAGVAVADLAGRPLAALSAPVDGERDPINGQRTRYQMGEIVTWLRSGEIHEYALRNVCLTRTETTVSVTFDLYPAQLAWQAATYPELAAELEALRADAAVTAFFVAIRMPQRYAVLLQDAALAAAQLLTLHDAAGSPGAPLPADFFAATLQNADFLQNGVVAQID